MLSGQYVEYELRIAAMCIPMLRITDRHSHVVFHVVLTEVLVLCGLSAVVYSVSFLLQLKITI